MGLKPIKLKRFVTLESLFADVVWFYDSEKFDEHAQYMNSVLYSYIRHSGKIFTTCDRKKYELFLAEPNPDLVDNLEAATKIIEKHYEDWIKTT